MRRRDREALNEQLGQYGEPTLAWYEKTAIEPLVNVLGTTRGAVVDGTAFAVQALTNTLRLAQGATAAAATLGEVAEVVEHD